LRDLNISKQTFADLWAAVARGGGVFAVKPADVRAALKAAADRVGVTYQGTHGLRWSWAQERFAELQRGGRTREEALVAVSHDLGHHRPDITERYLK
jgi:integrase